MLVSAAICPHPPLLVPGIGPRHDGRLEVLRDACWSALHELRNASPELLVVVGAGTRTEPDVAGVGDFADYGVPRRVALPGRLPDAASDSGMPLSLCVGAWLLERDGWRGQVAGASVARTATRDECVRLGADTADRADRVALLVMADGAPGHAHDETPLTRSRAGAHDLAFVAAIGSGDPRQILALDDEAAAAAGSDGVKALNVLAGAGADTVFDVDVTYDAAPFGVGYTVAVWERHG